jgi:hypothetical protein
MNILIVTGLFTDMNRYHLLKNSLVCVIIVIFKLQTVLFRLKVILS